MSDSAPSELLRLARDHGLDATGSGGEPLSSVGYRVQAERTVGVLAETLARLHATPMPEVLRVTALHPHAIAAQVRHQLEHVRAQRDPPPRAAAYAHLDDARLVQVLADGAGAVERRGGRAVITHGAPTLDRCLADRGTALGLVDWRRAAVADPYRDLAVAAASVASLFAPILVPVLFERYGEHQPDPVRLDWYSLAAELSGALADPVPGDLLEPDPHADPEP